MLEKISGAIIEFDKPVCPDNLDFETRLIIRKAREKGYDFQFGKYDRRDGTIEVIIERPDPAPIPAPGSKEEWEEKRDWYLEHAKTDYKLFAKGICEGWLTQDSQMTTGFTDDWAILEDWLGYIESDDPPWWEKLEDRLEWERYLKEQRRKELAIKRQEYRERNPLKMKERKITKTGIRFIKKITKPGKIQIDLPEEAMNQPWETYEKLKQIYTTESLTSRQYETRIENLLNALKI